MSFSPSNNKNSKTHNNSNNQIAQSNSSSAKQSSAGKPASTLRQNKNNNMPVKELKLRNGKAKVEKPRIVINLDVSRGKTTIYQFNRAYINAILLAGGIPVVVPPTKQRDMVSILATCDGVILIGGRDYNPRLYGENPSASISPLDQEREEFDLRFIKYLVNRTRLPILGICGGLQLINIHFGGSLVQDIESLYPGLGENHRSEIKQPHADHPVALRAGGKLRKIYGRRRLTSVVSSHHQAIKTLGKGLQLECSAEDGIAEGLSHSKHPYLVGVQWHPELNVTAGDGKILLAFVSAAKAA